MTEINPASDTFYVCVDVEASGPFPNPYNLVSIGAVGVSDSGSKEGWVVHSEDLFYIEIAPAYDGFSDEAMAIHGISREHLEKNGVPPEEAMKRFAGWMEARCSAPVFVGHNAVFDWAYINHYFLSFFGGSSPFGWKGLDTKSLAAGVLGIPFLETSKENLARLLPGLGAEDLDSKHRADYDALYQARILTHLLNAPVRPR